MSSRDMRYQGAIIRGQHILLLKQRIYPDGRIVWLFPGGHIEPGETEEECVKREMKEETGLDVIVEQLLFDRPDNRTYMCEATAGEPFPGYDPEYGPEVEAAGLHGIMEVKWFDLQSEANRDQLLVNDPIIYLPLKQVREKLGYLY